MPRTDRRTHELREDLFGDVARRISTAYAKQLKETLRRAIDDGYDGVDVVHDEIEFLFKGPRTSAWRARKWREEPSSTPDESYRRYDFRYYDRESLLHLLEKGEWPENGESDP